MKKALATLLCLLMLGTTALVSCNNDSDNTSSTAGDNSSAASTASDTASDSTDTSVDENGWVDGIVGYLGDGKWGRAGNYTMCFSTSKISKEKICDTICNYIKTLD